MVVAQSNGSPEVVVVGGGIAGAALATALAAEGREVLVLEATEQFEDRIRGESMMPWGVAEAIDLEVADALFGAGAQTAGAWWRWSEGSDEPQEIPVGLLVAGVDGTLNLEHRLASQALLDAAAAAGAGVCRGVRDVQVAAGAPPEVSFTWSGATRSARPRVIVGADGRSSTVRRSIGIHLERQAAIGFVAGMLLDGVGGPVEGDIVFEHGRGMCLLLHQGGGRARGYHCVDPGLRARYAGPGGPARFLADATAAGSPVAGALATARPAGPCGAFPGIDTWTDRPFVDGVVLIGDAAGHNDPTVGCGLSIAMRDARMVRDLLLGNASRAADFAAYGIERAERMRRLRLLADVMATASVVDGPDRSRRRRHFADAMAAMDPEVFPVVLSMFTGPETVPAEAFDQRVVDRVRVG